MVASAAIAGGAAISSNAMAAGTGPDEAPSTVHLVSITSDGEVVSCDYEGVDFPVLISTAVDGGVLAVSGTYDTYSRTDATGSAEAGTVIVSSVSATGDGEFGLTPAPPGDLPNIDDLKVISTDDARPGTPEECAELSPVTASAP